MSTGRCRRTPGQSPDVLKRASQATPSGRAAAIGLALAIVLVAAGCGTGGLASAGTDKDRGKQLFVSKCGGCHTLAAAGTHGITGPNLDDAFAGDRAQDFEESTIQQVVHDQIKFAEPPMPANLVRGADAENVATYVASVAGLSGASGGASATASNDGKTIFKTNCASCHTLKDAGTTGTVGPNLDQLHPPLARVKQQVINGGGAMPPFKDALTPKQIDAVAKYVSSVAGK